MSLILNCAVVGAGSTFRIPIDEKGSVGDLKRSMAAEILKNFETDKLQLLLAKKDGQWLVKEDLKKDMSKLASLKGMKWSLRSVGVVG
ncbi:hypothetical protein P3T76_011636 [Phytophthora citrophthora]|uniref:Crinkler effector protein N-terminal domain-containing protein n=1 Tax=Phytophthora citrophthora TaxID=4793 RepID=A0AAD9LF10_9STRA|nr:hypothetical protein P3T76_011636 [Phytophthora citrophthora]